MEQGKHWNIGTSSCNIETVNQINFVTKLIIIRISELGEEIFKNIIQHSFFEEKGTSTQG